MTTKDDLREVDDLIVPRHVLLSVSDKGGLTGLIGAIRAVNPDAMFYSTGGTGTEVKKILGSDAGAHYVPVESFTGMPEMDGGLVKTLHPSIHAGLLGNRRNPKHLAFFNEVLPGLGAQNGVYFDVAVVGLYPFEEVVQLEDVTPEMAKEKIDIGGHTMIRAAAKNWHGVAALSDPSQYNPFVNAIVEQRATTLRQRFSLAQDAFALASRYDAAIDKYMSSLDFDKDVMPTLSVAA